VVLLTFSIILIGLANYATYFPVFSLYCFLLNEYFWIHHMFLSWHGCDHFVVHRMWWVRGKILFFNFFKKTCYKGKFFIIIMVYNFYLFLYKLLSFLLMFDPLVPELSYPIVVYWISSISVGICFVCLEWNVSTLLIFSVNCKNFDCFSFILLLSEGYVIFFYFIYKIAFYFNFWT